MPDAPDWKVKEEIIGLLRRAVGGWTVHENVKIPHAITGTPRQVDVLLEQQTGGVTARLLFEIKAEKHPLDVKKVEGITRMYDHLVGGGQLFIVSWSGFTPEAHAVGSAFGAVMVTVGPEEGHLNLYADEVTLTPRRVALILDVPGEGATRCHPEPANLLYRDDGSQLDGDVYQLWLGMMELFKDGQSPLVKGLQAEAHNHPQREDVSWFTVRVPVTGSRLHLRHEVSTQLHAIEAVEVVGEISWSQVPLTLALQRFGELLFGHGEAEILGQWTRAVATLNADGSLSGVAVRVYGNRAGPVL